MQYFWVMNGQILNLSDKSVAEKVFGVTRDPDVTLTDEKWNEYGYIARIGNDGKLMFGLTEEEKEKEQEQQEKDKEMVYNSMNLIVQAATVNFTLPANGTKDVTFTFEKDFADASIVPVLVFNSRTNCHFVHVLTATTSDSCTYHFHNYETADNMLSVTARAIGKIQ